MPSLRSVIYALIHLTFLTTLVWSLVIAGMIHYHTGENANVVDQQPSILCVGAMGSATKDSPTSAHLDVNAYLWASVGVLCTYFFYWGGFAARGWRGFGTFWERLLGNLTFSGKKFTRYALHLYSILVGIVLLTVSLISLHVAKKNSGCTGDQNIMVLKTDDGTGDSYATKTIWHQLISLLEFEAWSMIFVLAYLISVSLSVSLNLQFVKDWDLTDGESESADVENGGGGSEYVKRSPSMAKMEIVSSTNTKNSNDQSKFRF